jgi:glycosyltransferase involved in cell wall biosynthesis
MRDAKRICVLLWDGNVGGGERLSVELAGALRRIDVDARMLFVRDPGALAGDLDRLEVPYETFGATRAEEVLWRPRAFAAQAARLGPDGILIPNVGHLAVGLRLGGYRAPVVSTQHGYLLLIEQLPPALRLARHLERLLALPLVDAEVAVSEWMAERIRRSPMPPRIELIHNGIDLERFAPAMETGRERSGCVIACACRLVPGKGLPELIRAFGELAADDPRATLRIAGDGPDRPGLAALIEQLGLGGRVELAGVVHDMPAFWRDCDIAATPSTLPESFGLTALEAMATAKPVVAARHGGLVELVRDGVTGRLVAPGDVGELTAALQAYIADPDERRRHGLAGRERCEAAFGAEHCAGRYADLVSGLEATRLASGRRFLGAGRTPPSSR